MTIDAVDIPEGWTALSGGPKFNNTKLESGSGYIAVNQNWSYALWEYQVSYIKNDYETTTGDRLDNILNFFLNRAAARAFLVKDPFDYQSTGRGATGYVETISGALQMTKRYPDVTGALYHTRLITRPVSGTITLSGGAGGGTIDYTTGIVTGAAAGGWVGQFKIPMIYLEDQLKYDVSVDGVVRTVNVGLREIRV